MSKQTLRDFESEIIELREKGYGSRKIAEELKEKHGYETGSSNVRRFLRRRGIGGAPNTFEQKLEENNFQMPQNWGAGWIKSKEASIYIKNSENLISFEEARQEFLEQMMNYSPQIPTIKREPIKDKHLLVIDIADLHVGKLAEASETGDKYNSKIAKKRAIRGVEGILQKSSGFPIDKILFIIGNDVLHVDISK